MATPMAMAMTLMIYRPVSETSDAFISPLSPVPSLFFMLLLRFSKAIKLNPHYAIIRLKAKG